MKIDLRIDDDTTILGIGMTIPGSADERMRSIYKGEIAQRNNTQY
jgi:hypothetical protein